METHFPSRSEFQSLLSNLLAPESGFYRVVVIYSLAISLMTLAVPISVQMLIDTVANTALMQPVIVLSSMLFGLLILSGILYALRSYSMDLFKRHLFARLTSEIALTAISAKTRFFEEDERHDLFNRYFDIMTLKKNLPHVLTSGFSLILQSMIGFLVVSLYHWMLLLFNLSLIAALYLIWRLWGWRAINSAFALSEEKYQNAAWLEGLTINQGFFKSSRHVNYALEKTNQLIHRHINAQENHFRHRFQQLIGLLFLYALASALLLGVGGYLVIQGELSLGQLVAAELIMSAIFAGFPQLSTYLSQIYEIAAAVEELSRFKNIPVEDFTHTEPEVQTATDTKYQQLELNNVKLQDAQQHFQFDIRFDAKPALIRHQNTATRRAFKGLLKQEIQAQSGSIVLNGADIESYDLFDLRHHIVNIDRTTLLPISIRDYLKLANPQQSTRERDDVLELLELSQVISDLPQGFDTRLSSNAWPMSDSEALRLKLCAAILSQAKVILLGELFDVVGTTCMQNLINYFKQQQRCLLYFTHRTDLVNFTETLIMNEDEQHWLKQAINTTQPSQ